MQSYPKLSHQQHTIKYHIFYSHLYIAKKNKKQSVIH